MRREFAWYRNLILGALVSALAADMVLAAYFYRVDSSVLSPKAELKLLSEQRKLLQTDISAARAIQDNFPKTKTDCEIFEKSLPASGNGYSVISIQLSKFAHEATLQLGALTFRQKSFPGKAISEIAIDATIEGDYKGVVHFLNDLQRTENTYVLEDLALASDTSSQSTTGKVKVTVHLKTYFRVQV